MTLLIQNALRLKVRGSTQQQKFVFNELNSIKKKVIEALACQNMQIISENFSKYSLKNSKLK